MTAETGKSASTPLVDRAKGGYAATWQLGHFILLLLLAILALYHGGGILDRSLEVLAHPENYRALRVIHARVIVGADLLFIAATMILVLTQIYRFTVATISPDNHRPQTTQNK